MRIRLLDRYLLRELVMPLFVCLALFVLFFISFDLISSLNRFQEHHLTTGDVFELYAVKLPQILVFILPIVLLLALLYALTNHARNNEILAMRAAGVSLWRTSAVYLWVGAFFSLVVLFMNERYVPTSQERQDAIMRRHDSAATLDRTDIERNLFYENSREHRQWTVGLCDFKNQVLYNPQISWRKDGYDWHLIAHRAERPADAWIFYGITTFSTNDITNLPQLAAALKNPDSNIAQYLRTNLAPETIALLNSYSTGENAALRRGLAQDLNHLMLHEMLYDQRRFYGVKLSPDVVELIAQKPEGTDLVELNLLLLSDAFPNLISRQPLYGVKLYRGVSGKNQELAPYLYTNRLVMAQFGETFENFAAQVKFDSYSRGELGSGSIEVPISEMMNYLHIHPDLPSKDRAKLRTQLHGRIAQPWTCIMVVLIAIPFGTLSSRKNIFVGVAGALAICFIYFVLLKTCLAFGSAGILPGWMAAWLPNVFFGFVGFTLISRVQ